MSDYAGEVQRIETRRAFYAGAVSMFHLFQTEGDSEEEAIKVFEDVRSELKGFSISVERGEA